MTAKMLEELSLDSSRKEKAWDCMDCVLGNTVAHAEHI